MHLVTFTFDVHEEDQSSFIVALERIKPFWERRGIRFSIYRDTTQKMRFLQILQTEKSIEEITSLIHEDEDAREVFDMIKKTSGRVSISFLERVV